MRSKPTSNTGIPSSAAPIDTSNANPQEGCPLFSRIPAELRNDIFNLALTAYPGKQVPCKKSVDRCRPGFLYADVRIDTALLRSVDTSMEKHDSSHSRILCILQWCDETNSDLYATVSRGNTPKDSKALSVVTGASKI